LSVKNKDAFKKLQQAARIVIVSSSSTPVFIQEQVKKIIDEM